MPLTFNNSLPYCNCQKKIKISNHKSLFPTSHFNFISIYNNKEWTRALNINQLMILEKYCTKSTIMMMKNAFIISRINVKYNSHFSFSLPYLVDMIRSTLSKQKKDPLLRLCRRSVVVVYFFFIWKVVPFQQDRISESDDKTRF